MRQIEVSPSFSRDVLSAFSSAGDGDATYYKLVSVLMAGGGLSIRIKHRGVSEQEIIAACADTPILPLPMNVFFSLEL